MKLSQKLLGLAGLAMADYACCPYDDYGLPHGACVTALPEKTPFSSDADWYGNACKAWEANIDATYEGNPIGGCADDNWGGCGFQRHFEWGLAASAELSTDVLTGFSMEPTNAPGAFGDAFNSGGASNIARDFTGGTATMAIGGRPFLGGICKLFIPVHQSQIDQVSIAGVHVSGDSISQYKGAMQANAGADTLEGTFYCFSVVNIQEFKTNTNNVANGNVAGDSGAVHGDGTDTDFHTDIFDGKNSLERQAGIGIGAFGEQAAEATTGSGMQKMGNNFDVVAHLNSAFCLSEVGDNANTAQIVDMQMSPDSLSGAPNDYEYDHDSADFTHAHTDVLDKRHAKAAYPSGGAYLQDGSNPGYLASNLRWPNMGAWAAYYSVVSCSNAYTAGDDYDIGNNDISVVHSVSSNDFRQDDSTAACTGNWANYRFNVRQVGNPVEICGPGQLPDTSDKRCTWNWNYHASGDFGPGSDTDSDPEGFFDRNDNMAFSVWARKRRDAVGRTDTANNVAASLETVTIAMTFADQDNNAILATNMDALVVDSVDGVSATDQTIKVECINSIPAGQNQRDAFPTCFTGDEIHASLAYKPLANSVRDFISPWFTLATYASAALP